MLRRRKLRTATYALAGTVAAAAALAAGPARAAEPLPSYWCYLNGVEVPSGQKVVRGTAGVDTILCENDVENVIIDGGNGDDNIRVKGMLIDAQVLGGEGDDTLQVNNLYPKSGNSSVRGGLGNDTIITALVVGTADHGASVYGDHGDDKITTGSVMGQPGEYERGGGQVFGNDGSDLIRTGNVDLGGRVLGGSENDIIEPKSVGAESAGIVQGGPGNDTVRGLNDTVLTIGPGYGQVDGGIGTNSCRVRHFSTGDRVRSSLANCANTEAGPAPPAAPAKPADSTTPAKPAASATPAKPAAPASSAHSPR
ncbi:Hemolysin-type calcium-binding region protein [Actinobacteria bacterium OV450]|nr:Hemolysin-type calcium-binding region protein [Actinobacteria bacterium OV450]